MGGARRIFYKDSSKHFFVAFTAICKNFYTITSGYPVNNARKLITITYSCEYNKYTYLFDDEYGKPL